MQKATTIRSMGDSRCHPCTRVWINGKRIPSTNNVTTASTQPANQPSAFQSIA